MRRHVLALVILAGVTACSKSRSSSSTTGADDEKIVSQAKRMDLQMDQIRRAALAAAKDTIMPRPDLGVCPIVWKPHLAPRTHLDGDAATNTTYWNVGRWDASDEKVLGIFSPHVDDEMVSIERLGIAFADEVAGKPGPRHFRIAADSRLPLGARQRGELEKYVDATYEANDHQLVIDAEREAKAAGKVFESGLLTGRFYVFDHAKRAIVCASHVVVRNSSSLIVRYTAEFDGKTSTPTKDNKEQSAAEHLRGDLRQQALLAASESLFVAGPVVTLPRGE